MQIDVAEARQFSQGIGNRLQQLLVSMGRAGVFLHSWWFRARTISPTGILTAASHLTRLLNQQAIAERIMRQV
jgi:hypothetical protein